MNSLVAPSHTLADRIPLGRRIEELKKEKGGWYSTAAMSERIGLSAPTFRDMLKSRRDIYTFELDRIANDLKIPVERILQKDTKEETQNLVSMLRHRNNPDDALTLALSLSVQTIGLTERCIALLRLGQAYFRVYKFSDSIRELKMAHQLALKIQDQYSESEVLYDVVHRLMPSYTAIGDFLTASDLLSEIMPYFSATPDKLSSISYQRAMVEESKGNLITARKYAQDSLEHAMASDNYVLVSKAYFNLAHFEFRLTNYSTSQEFLEIAIHGFEKDLRSRLMVRKETVKAMLKQGLNESALAELEIALGELKQFEWRDMKGKLTILYAVATGDPSYAQTILDDEEYSLKIRYLASKCLQDHYRLNGDGSMFLHYHEIAETLCLEFSDFLDEVNL